MLVDKYSPSDKNYKDKLWAIFRTASTQLRLNAQLDEIIKTENSISEKQLLDDYHTFYTEFMDINDC